MSKANSSWENDKSSYRMFQFGGNVEVATSSYVDNEQIIQPISQQKLASLMPRGTRIDSSGNRIQVKGARNYTSQNIHVGRDEVFDDVVVRGLRADGLSTKFGIKNNKEGISKLLRELFHNDERWPLLEDHFKTRRQKSNCAKTIFSTMTHEELQIIKAETFPSRIDVQVRDYLIKAFAENLHKLQDTVEVLEQVQQVFKMLTPQTDFLSTHNFQTRGFFLDITLMTCSFIMQIIQDSDKPPKQPQEQQHESPEQSVQATTDAMAERMVQQVYQENKENGKLEKNAAEILLTVGGGMINEEAQRKSMPFEIVTKIPSDTTSQKQDQQVTAEKCDTVVDFSDDTQWTTVEMIDAEGNTKYMLIKTENEANILQILQSPEYQENILTAANQSVMPNAEIITDGKPNSSEYTSNNQHVMQTNALHIITDKHTVEDNELNKDLHDTIVEIKQLMESEKQLTDHRKQSSSSVQIHHQNSNEKFSNNQNNNAENMKNLSGDGTTIHKRNLLENEESIYNKRMKNS